MRKGVVLEVRKWSRVKKNARKEGRGGGRPNEGWKEERLEGKEWSVEGKKVKRVEG